MVVIKITSKVALLIAKEDYLNVLDQTYKQNVMVFTHAIHIDWTSYIFHVCLQTLEWYSRAVGFCNTAQPQMMSTVFHGGDIDILDTIDGYNTFQLGNRHGGRGTLN